MVNIKDIYKGYIWYNGNFVPWQECNIHVFTNSLHYASSAFEGIRSYDGKIFKLKEHIDRLLYSSGILGLSINYSHEELYNCTYELLVKNNLANSYIRPLIWRGDDELTIKFYDNHINVMIAAYHYDSTFNPKIALNIMVTPWRKGPKNTMPHQAKTSGNYVVNIVASSEIKKLNYDDVLFLDFEDNIAELTSSNVFFVKQGKLITPSSDYFLNGITRQSIIEIAKQNNIEIEERKIKLDELKTFDEAFACGTAMELATINSISLQNNNNSKIVFPSNLMTIKLAELYSKLVKGI